MRRFVLNRHEDESGVSGTGIVAQGTLYDSGKISLLWLNSNSFGLWDDIEDMLKVHGHNGKTVVDFIDE